MKKLFALTLVALATAACDAGLAGSSGTTPAASGGAPAMCPTMKGGSDCGPKSGDCGECVEPAAGACEDKGACEEMSPADCKKACEEQMPECKKACEPKVGE